MPEQGEPRSPGRHHAVEAARNHLGLSIEDLWIAYMALGGHMEPGQIRAFLEGRETLPPVEFNVLAQAINDEARDQQSPVRVPFQRQN